MLLTGLTLNTVAAGASNGLTVLATGQVPYGAGSTVLLYEWPAKNILFNMHVGTGFHPTLVSTTVANSSGQFTLDAPVGVQGEFQVEAIGRGGFSTYHFTSNGGPVKITLVRLSSTPLKAPNVSSASAMYCDTWYPYKDLGLSWDVVGAIFNDNAPWVSGQFSYEAGASSTIGEGVSLTSQYGSWTQDGTTTVADSGGESYPPLWRNASNYMETEVHTEEFEMKTCPYWNVHMVYATVSELAGGAYWPVAGNYLTTNKCVYQGPGSQFSDSTSTAVEWTDGFSLGTVLGVNLSTQTGYSTEASLVYRFDDAGYICGSNDYPMRDPALLQAQLTS